MAMKRRAGEKREHGMSPVERLANFPVCPGARNVSSKPLRSLDKYYKQMFWVEWCGKNIDQGQHSGDRAGESTQPLITCPPPTKEHSPGRTPTAREPPRNRRAKLSMGRGEDEQAR